MAKSRGTREWSELFVEENLTVCDIQLCQISCQYFVNKNSASNGKVQFRRGVKVFPVPPDLHVPLASF